ncbi:ABC transporter ATPase [Psychroflexus maritimus]|uniref:ABC transporter ATPase n=1 Tax=Psychroflexus maritimus TaxID=2714865 RepID=A0A967AGB2_9FLAO|nr:ABC transporter ATPase [Psychroflexus maritimus]NGZ90718.1 ABC transporter ATPase [Psychroflexus maritimus]
MLKNFKELPGHARIWVYQANRSFTEEEVAEMNIRVSSFLEKWTAHGKDLAAGFLIKYNRFLILGLDPTNGEASGCSIDAQVHFIQELEKIYEVDLLDRMNVSFKQGKFIAYKELKEFKKMVKQKAVSSNTIVFNNLVNNKSEFEEHWEVPITDSWHSRFL